jgi:hypothetical protein
MSSQPSKEPIEAHGDSLVEAPRVPAQAGSIGEERLVVNTIRCLAADLCQQVSSNTLHTAYAQFKGGHPGTVMGAATIGIALWRYHMRFNPSSPGWVGRDREWICLYSLSTDLQGLFSLLGTRVCFSIFSSTLQDTKAGRSTWSNNTMPRSCTTLRLGTRRSRWTG